MRLPFLGWGDQALDDSSGGASSTAEATSTLTSASTFPSHTMGPPPPELGDPLLPTPFARSVTLGTDAILGAVRTARSVGRVPFHVARYTTAASIEMGRFAFDSVLGQSGREVYAQYAKRRGVSDTERARVASVVASTFDAAHRGFYYLQLFTAAGFEMTGTSVATLMDISEVVVLMVDSILGSTESSRALRSIVVFLSREFQNPATGLPGERVGMRDLLWGLCGLVYLQSVCRRADEQEWARLNIETVVWDVVVLDGRRVDVHENSLYGTHSGAYKRWDDENDDNNNNRNNSNEQDKDMDNTEMTIRREIAAAVANDARVTVSTSTAKIITVDITANEPPPPIAPPPGVELVELGPLHPSQATKANVPNTYRIVFRINTNDVATTTTGAGKDMHLVEQVESEPEVPMLDNKPANPDKDKASKKEKTDEPRPPPPPPKRSHSRRSPSPSVPQTTLLTPISPSSARHGPSRARTPTGTATATATATPPPPLASPAVPPARTSSRANQKKVRMPAGPPTETGLPDGGSVSEEKTHGKDKVGPGFRSVLKKPHLPNLLHKEGAASAASPQGKIRSQEPARRSSGSTQTRPPTLAPPPPPKKQRTAGSGTSAKTTSTTSTTSGPLVFTPLTTRALHRHDLPAATNNIPSPVDSHHRKRRSLLADDLESLASFASSMADNISMQTATGGNSNDSPMQALPATPSTTIQASAQDNQNQRLRSHGHRSSIYTLHTDSQTSLVLSAYGGGDRWRTSADNATANGGHGSGGSAGMLDELRRTGTISGLFPRVPLLRSLRRYMRFSSAAYGRDFLRAMGIAQYFGGIDTSSTTLHGATPTAPPPHREIASYAHHTGIAPEDVVVASFIDASGGPDATGRTRMPLVHYISLDHTARAVVLACRGTLGFEDILADMACDYDDLFWRGRTYQVHKGVHASARRLLWGGDGRVVATLRDLLLQYPDYGLVLCGHSLGGAVTALLGVMLSSPSTASASGPFETAATPRLLLADSGGRQVPSLPAGRPVHVFAYGPPGTMSPALRRATRGLITSVVQANDLVPYLSLGVLHDFQAVALAFKTDDSQASAELWARLWERFRSVLADKWYHSTSSSSSSSSSSLNGNTDDHNNSLQQVDAAMDDTWAYAARKTLRASMLSDKLLPPGEVLVVETQPVLQRVTYGRGGQNTSPKDHSSPAEASLTVSPARRVVLKHVRDVEARFREIRFGGLTALGDHSPGRYEKVLDLLDVGVQL